MSRGCGCFAEVRIWRRKRGSQLPHSKVSGPGSRGQDGLRWELRAGICDAGNKKSGREAAAIGKNLHSCPGSRIPNEV